MKKKLFVVSDIHSAYTPLKKALDEKGFDPNNKNHWLIVCGDAFDRMDESEEVLHFLMSLERKILVKGNHDILLEECCSREFPYRHDYSNGTVRTINDIGGAGEGKPFDECCRVTWNKLTRYRELLVNYFETQNYIFVHSWIPTNKKTKPHPTDKWATLITDKWMKDWRNATSDEWEEAMWVNPFMKAQDRLNQTGKTIVFGHFHTSWAYSKDENISEFGEDAKFDIYYGEDYIGLDACTAYTGKVNVLVLEDEFFEEEKRRNVMKNKFNSLSWKVKNFDVNRDVIEDYDVLKYRENFIKKLKKRCATKEEFSEELRREFQWQYWSRCEYELIIEVTKDQRVLLKPWVGSRDEEKATIDVTNDTSFDWKNFANEHIRQQIFKNEAKIDVYDQLKWRWDEFVDYCWYTRLKYERRDPKFDK